jgi:cell division protein FtsB
MILASLVVIIILIVVGVNAVSLGRRLVENKKRLETLREEIRMEDERADDIDEYRRYTRTDAYIEEVAREKLGLIYEGETVFKEENK